MYATFEVILLILDRQTERQRRISGSVVGADKQLYAIAKHCDTLPFIALTVLVGRQEGHPACKKTRWLFVGGDDLTGALHELQLQLLPPLPSSLASSLQ